MINYLYDDNFISGKIIDEEAFFMIFELIVENSLSDL